jgi:hypothetical protein
MSPSTSFGPTGASPDLVSAAPSADHAGGAEIVQSPAQAHGDLAVEDDGIGDESEDASADATTDPGEQSEPGNLDSDGQSSEGSVVDFPNKAGGRVGGASRSLRAGRGRRGRVSEGENGFMTMLASQMVVMDKLATVIQGQQDGRQKTAPPAGGDVGRPGVGVDASSVLAHPAVQVLQLCRTALTTAERQSLDSTVRGWVVKTTAAVHTSVEVFEATVTKPAGSAKVYALVQMMQEAKEAKPPVSSAPWIVVDGQHIECPHGKCDLLAVVCKRLKDARLVPPACTGKM